MTKEDSVERPTAYDPASMAISSLSTHKVIWYKRPWVMVTLVILVVVAVSVITDLPHPISRADDARAQDLSMKQINVDIAPCIFAVQESFRFYRNAIEGTLDKNRLKIVNTYLPNDQTVCSFASAGMSDLTNNLDIRQTTAGQYIDKMLKVVVTWMDSDANHAIVDVQYLIKHPGDPATMKDLGLRERYLSEDRVKARAYLDAASAHLGIPLTALKLPELAALPGI